MPNAVLQALPIFTRVVEGAGFSLVRLRLSGTQRQTLQVMAERPDGSMNVEDCAHLSEVLSDFIEVEDPIGGDYVLEVSSPGIDRPLTRLTDFVRWAGFDAKIELVAPMDGKKRLKAVLKGLAGNEILVEANGKPMQFPFAAVAEAKLILTDKLIDADLAARQNTAPPPSVPSKNSRQNARKSRATGD